jgi:serine carboxypeptidase-like clade 1
MTITNRWVHVQDVADINIYDVLEPCYHSSDSSAKSRSSSRLPMSFRRLGEVEGSRRVRKRMFGRGWPLRLSVGSGRVPTWGELQDDLEVPCTVSDCFLILLSSTAILGGKTVVSWVSVQFTLSIIDIWGLGH